MLWVMDPFRICTDWPRDSTGPAITSKPSNEGALKVPSSGLAFSANSTRTGSPNATVSGEEASKVIFPAPSAGKTASRKPTASVIFAIKCFIESTNVSLGPLISSAAGNFSA